MVDFTSILSRRVEDVEKPKPRPVGTYRGSIQGMYQQKTVKVQGEDRGIISFKVKMQVPHDDVDQEALSEAGEISTWPPMNHDIWADTPEGEWQLRQFLTDVLGIEGEGSFGEMLAQTPGRQLNATLGHRPFVNKAGQPEIATEIKSTSAV